MTQQKSPQGSETLAQILAKLKAQRPQQPERPAIAGLPDNVNETTPGGIAGLQSTERPAIAGLPE